MVEVVDRYVGFPEDLIDSASQGRNSIRLRLFSPDKDAPWDIPAVNAWKNTDTKDSGYGNFLCAMRVGDRTLYAFVSFEKGGAIFIPYKVDGMLRPDLETGLADMVSHNIGQFGGEVGWHTIYKKLGFEKGTPSGLSHSQESYTPGGVLAKILNRDSAKVSGTALYAYKRLVGERSDYDPYLESMRFCRDGKTRDAAKAVIVAESLIQGFFPNESTQIIPLDAQLLKEPVYSPEFINELFE